MSNTSEKQSRFATLVPTVNKFPLPMVIFASLLLLINVFAVANFLFNMAGFMPGLATGEASAVKEVSLMLSGRHLGPVILLLFALLYKNTRVMQLAWFVVIVREVFDMLGTLARGDAGAGALIFVIVVLVAEIAAFIYTGAIASGHVAKYLPNQK